MPDGSEFWSGLDSTDRIAVKAVCAIVPGYGPVGKEFGTLVPTDGILGGIRPARSQTGESDLPVSFLKDKLGIESVATTHATAAVARAAVAGDLDWTEAAARIPRPDTNPDVLAMITRAMDTALSRHEEASGSRLARDRSIAGHIHFGAVTDNAASFALPAGRRAVGCHKPGLPVDIMLSGCAGLLVALRHARFLLRHTAARHDPDAYVLITAASDLMPFAHARGRAPATHRADINSWLFQAIFGEGAGAVVVGHADGSGHDWLVEDVRWRTVADDWRVNLAGGSTPHMTIRAREVSSTFRGHVPGVARQGLSALGLSTFDDLHRLCIHESNPNLVSGVVGELGVPPGLVHSISSHVGTLAGVSAFSLLDEALRTHQQTPGARDSVVCALIGETCHAVIAGHLALRHITR
ncbi:hypothetical protein CUT44_22095 [Streptomyces carminius]|uniref:3-oxoacyl-ACP synthase n=1 Tax=Streptomyces carminius TaxID=2665496 RepID=A0A2M8LUN2_9ACTN|nr:hypothetical protein [Streptomyces carminius]PJE95660.1 hypothetical protein CUT44_22095 [Streptomyces carminius]